MCRMGDAGYPYNRRMNVPDMDMGLLLHNPLHSINRGIMPIHNTGRYNARIDNSRILLALIIDAG